MDSLFLVLLSFFPALFKKKKKVYVMHVLTVGTLSWKQHVIAGEVYVLVQINF